MANKNIIRKSALTPTVLIAGGAGFIGSNLAETLLLQNARVVVLDNFSTGNDVYISPLLSNPKFALFNVDINKGLPEEIESVDYIFHLAGVETYLTGHDEVSLNTLLTNSLGTKNLLDLAQKSNAKFLLVSSINIYQGVVSSLNLDRYYGSTVQEERKYSLAEAKRYAEALVGEYYKRYNTNVRIARIPEVYGPRMDLSTGSPISTFLKDLLEDNDITLFGEGTEKEYYIYITDVVAGIIKTLFNEHTEGKIYSLVDREPFTSLELAYLLKSMAHREISINFKNKSSLLIPLNAEPDTSNIGDLKWGSKVELKEGLLNTLKWFGYETNQHSFKPNQLIEKKAQEKQSEATIIAPNISKSGINLDLKESFLKFGHKVESIVHEVQEHNPIEKMVHPHEYKEPKVESPKIQKPLSNKSKITISILAGVLVLATIFVGLPLFQTYVYLKNAYAEINMVPDQIVQLDPTAAANASNKTYINLNKAQKSLSRLKWITTITGQEEKYNVAQNVIGSTKYFAKATYNGAKAIAPFEQIVQVIRPDSQETLKVEQINESQLYLANARSELQLAQAEFKKVDKNQVPAKYIDKIEYYEETLNKAVETIDIADAFATDMPNLLGIDAPRKYLFLFQNSNEIRPTGGFIGSYAVLELNNGKITSLTIDDVYNPDGQLDLREIVVPAPEPIISYLEEDKLHIRNANWDPDFATSANKIQDLFFRIDGSRFNGVIAGDLKLAQNLLNVTGPIYLTAYNEEITAENLYERTQLHSEFNYQEGVSNKKSFLTVLGSKLLERLFALPREQMPALATELGKSLDQKHMLIHLNNSRFSSVLSDKNWNGQIADTETDYLYVVNANLGGTKANYFVENTMKYEVSGLTRDGMLRSILTLGYKHTGEDYAWPGGPYTNYIRVLTPKDTKLTGARFIKDGKEFNEELIGPLTEEDAERLEKQLDGETIIDSGNIFEKVIIGNEGQYTSYEIPITVLPMEEAQLVLEYDLPPRLSLTKENAIYNLYWQKQPGTDMDKIAFIYNYPLGLSVDRLSPDLTQSDKYTSFEGELDSDKTFEIRLK